MRNLELSASGRGERLETELIFIWSCLGDEASIIIPNLWGSESFQVSVPGRWCTPIPWGQKPLYLGPFQTSPYVPLHLAGHLYPL